VTVLSVLSVVSPPARHVIDSSSSSSLPIFYRIRLGDPPTKPTKPVAAVSFRRNYKAPPFCGPPSAQLFGRAKKREFVHSRAEAVKWAA
jgi:hypothetical protein